MVKVPGNDSRPNLAEALRTATTPLVGREEEIELLMRRLNVGKAIRPRPLYC
jgi:hypothetical protein